MRYRLVLAALLVAVLGAGCGRSGGELEEREDGAGEGPSSPVQTTDRSLQSEDRGSAGALLAPTGSLDEAPALPREIWRQHYSSPVTASPAAGGGAVVVALADYTVRGLSASAGDEIWAYESTQLVSSLSAAPAVGGFVASGPAGTLLLDAEDGSLVWSADIGAAPGGRISTTSRAVYLPTQDGLCVALDPATGQQLWSADPAPGSSETVTGAFAALDGVLYASLVDGTVAAIRASDGQLVWSASLLPEGEVPGEGSRLRMTGGPSVRAGGVLAVTTSGLVFHLDREGGELRRLSGSTEDSQRDGTFVTTSPIDTGGALLIIDATGSVSRVIDPASQSAAIERAGALDSFLAGQPALLDSVVLAADAAGTLHGLDPATGRREWEFSLGTRLTGEMAFLSDTLYLAGSDGTLLALRFDVDTGTVPLLSAERPIDIPPSGRFRMEQRFVDLLYVADSDGVVEWQVQSSDPADELILTILDADDDVLATNMGKVSLTDNARAMLNEGAVYSLRVERAYPDEDVIVTLSSKLIE